MKHGLLAGVILCLVPVPLFLGCEGEQFGGTTDEGPIRCVPVSVRELDLEEESPLGFSAAEIMGFVGGAHEADFVWGPPGERQDEISVKPAPGATSLHVLVDESEAVYRHVDMAVEGGSWADGEGATCADELHIVTRVSVESDNGAFDEEVEMQLVAQQPLLVTGTLDLLAHGNDERELRLLKADSKLVDARLSLAWTPGGGFSGRAIVDYETRSGSDVSLAPSIVLANFPEQSVCDGEGVDLPESSAPAVAVHAALSDARGAQIVWSAGGEESLAWELSADRFCVRQPSPYEKTSGGLAFQVTATRQASDGASGQLWDVVGSATVSADGEISALLLDVGWESAPVVSASMFESLYGFDVQGLGDHDEAQLLLRLEWESDIGWQGSVTVQGRSHDDPCFPDNLTHPIPDECIVDNVYLGGWVTLDTGSVTILK